MSDLSNTLAELRRNVRLSRAQLEDVSGVSEATLKKIEYGRNNRPTPETLKKISTGLATNRALGRVDPSVADEILSVLMQAAGYVPKREPPPAPEPVGAPALFDMREALMAKGFRPDQSHVVDQILDDMADKSLLSDGQRAQILNAVAAMLASHRETPSDR